MCNGCTVRTDRRAAVICGALLIGNFTRIVLRLVLGLCRSYLWRLIDWKLQVGIRMPREIELAAVICGALLIGN